MGEDDLKTAERRGYGKGYAAGKARKEREISHETRRRRMDAFWQRAFIAALPAAFNAQGWARGETKITSLSDRMRLAADAADEAMKHAAPHL